ncbi:hypothetical protein Ocin01_15920 [Orchesella cincta]|uniref:Uncharacterized protein n=1 Tax=Orchesella cincta TaxID=48709 RepID=A0A1D2MCT5_ORCCI|nr:hypothetical protein Ocin01_15920 [Orchesella cincta]
MNDVVSEMKLKEERHTEPVEYDYFSPALMDCWPKIISFITGPQDLQALMNSCGLFYDLVEPRIFAELITPVLLHKKPLSRKGRPTKIPTT